MTTNTNLSFDRNWLKEYILDSSAMAMGGSMLAVLLAGARMDWLSATIRWLLRRIDGTFGWKMNFTDSRSESSEIS